MMKISRETWSYKTDEQYEHKVKFLCSKKMLLRVNTGVTPGIRNTFQTVKMQKKNILLVIGIIVEMI